MKRLSLAFVVVLGLMLAFTPLMSAYAEVQLPANIKFKGHALGICGVGRTLGGGPEAIVIGGGEGSGNMVVNGYAKATSYHELPYGTGDYFEIYAGAYFTAPEGYVKAAGSIAVRWFENNELHQLMVSICSKPTSLGVFQPETDKFLAGASFTGPLPYEEQMLGYRGIYKVGSNVQYLSGPIAVWASEGENPDLPDYEIEYIHVVLMYGEPLQYVIHIVWVSEPLGIPDPAGGTFTLPAARLLVHDVKLL
jgi:hypothetical protein